CTRTACSISRFSSWRWRTWGWRRSSWCGRGDFSAFARHELASHSVARGGHRRRRSGRDAARARALRIVRTVPGAERSVARALCTLVQLAFRDRRAALVWPGRLLCRWGVRGGETFARWGTAFAGRADRGDRRRCDGSSGRRLLRAPHPHLLLHADARLRNVRLRRRLEVDRGDGRGRWADRHPAGTAWPLRAAGREPRTPAALLSVLRPA